MRKEGKVRVYPRGRRGQIPIWQLDWTDPNGRRRRETICAPIPQMQKRCAEITQCIFEGECSHGKNGVRPQVWTIDKVLSSIINDQRKAQGANRTTLIAIANRFVRWIQETRPEISLWSDLQESDFAQYIDHMRQKGLCRISIMAYLKPLRSAARFLYEEYQIRNRIHKVKVPETIEDELYEQEREQQKCLSFDTIMEFLSFVRADRFDLHAPLCLQAMAGLRILEALNLRIRDVDFKMRTAKIETTAHHKVKTKSSRRTILLAMPVIDALRDHLQCQGFERGADDYFFSTQAKTHWHDWSYHRAVKRLFRKFGMGHYLPRNLRASFSSALRSDGADYRIVQSYMGHSLEDTLGKHYEIHTQDDYEREITSRIERICIESVTQSVPAVVEDCCSSR